MKVPRDISGMELARRLKSLDYSIMRQTGSHMRLTTLKNGEHLVTVPAHDPLKIGTLSAVLGDVSSHFGMSKEALLKLLF